MKRRWARAINDRTTAEGQRLNTPRNLDTWLPPTPRPQHGEAAREPFRKALAEGLREATQYAALFIVGGAGAYMDLGGNTSVRPLIELFAALDRPVAAICYGVEVLIQATDPKTKVPLVWGRLVTGHSEQDDYTDGTTDVPVEGGYGPNYGSATDHPRTDDQAIHRAAGRLHLAERQPVHGGRRRAVHHRANDARRLSGGVAGPRADARRRDSCRRSTSSTRTAAVTNRRLRRFAGSASKRTDMGEYQAPCLVFAPSGGWHK